MSYVQLPPFAAYHMSLFVVAAVNRCRHHVVVTKQLWYALFVLACYMLQIGKEVSEEYTGSSG
jgi:hypothetical protein